MPPAAMHSCSVMCLPLVLGWALAGAVVPAVMPVRALVGAAIPGSLLHCWLPGANGISSVWILSVFGTGPASNLSVGVHICMGQLSLFLRWLWACGSSRVRR